MHNPLHKIISAQRTAHISYNSVRKTLLNSAPNGQRFFFGVQVGLAKKHFFWLLFGLTALLACGKGKSEAETEDFVDKGVTTPAGEYPIVKEGTEPITLEIFTRAYDEEEQTFDDSNLFIRWITEKAGISLDFTTVNNENMSQRVNIIMASKDVPDIMMATSLGNKEIKYYGKQGQLRSFTPYIEKYGSIINEVFAAKPVARPMLSDLEGNIYALPVITECYHCFRGPKAWYYKPWLDKLGLEVPQTTEQFYEMLVAFKTQDPNGNGKADEIPLTGSNVGWDDSDIFAYLAGSFLYIAGWPGLTQNAGKVVMPKISPEYRDLLRYLNRLYREGLISDLTFTMNAADYKRTVGGHEPPIVGVALSQYPGMFAAFSKPGDRGLDDFYALPPLEGPKGIRYANIYDPYRGVNSNVVMAASNPYPAVTFRLLEIPMLPEAGVRAYLGVENVDWWKAPEGTKTLTGEDATWVDWDPENPVLRDPPKNNNKMPQRWPSVNIIGNEKFNLAHRKGRFPVQEGIDPDRAGYEEILQISSKKYYEPYSAPVSLTLPPLIIADELADEFTDLKSGIDEYIDQESVRFVRGEKSVETDWETYLETLDGLGLPRYLEINQQAYDEQKERWAAVQ